jgi:hypothetical protein
MESSLEATAIPQAQRGRPACHTAATRPGLLQPCLEILAGAAICLNDDPVTAPGQETVFPARSSSMYSVPRSSCW